MHLKEHKSKTQIKTLITVCCNISSQSMWFSFSLTQCIIFCSEFSINFTSQYKVFPCVTFVSWNLILTHVSNHTGFSFI